MLIGVIWVNQMTKYINAWTDYPITDIGDIPNKEAPIRKCKVLKYDGNKYCLVEVKGVKQLQTIKAGYLYVSPEMQLNDYKRISFDSLKEIFAEDFYD